MAEGEIVYVAVVPPASLDGNLVKGVAEVIGKDLYHARLLLVGSIPRVVARCTGMQTAESMAQGLKALKLMTIVSKEEELRKPHQGLKAQTMKFGEGEVDGIFCPNESSAYGMLQALRSAKRAGKVKFIGFDSSPKLIDALEKGEMHGTVVQNPFYMGYMGVKTCVAALRGTKVEKRIDTGCTIVTPENLKDPKIHELLYPPVKEFLNE